MRIKSTILLTSLLGVSILLVSCTGNENTSEEAEHIDVITSKVDGMNDSDYSKDTTVSEVINDPDFDDFGRLLFPVDRNVDENLTLEETSSNNVYVWYSEINVNSTLAVLNQLKNDAANGQQIFYPIYSDAEIEADADKKDTGLFLFRGETGAKFSIMNAGGGFMYVGAMHDSFPHALEVSKKGYNAFALIYRPDDPYNDLAKAIEYIFAHSTELEVDTDDYSLWGGSAGARMAAALGNQASLQEFGLRDIPQAAAVITQYSGYSSVSEYDVPTYANVGKNDGIANWKGTENRLDRLSQLGIPTKFEVYDNLSHGFGLGIGTEAEGWTDNAITFWEDQMK